uniref:Uncharacterized protein n=1 Tax=Solanum lycopersicum TaxID=4081 RepID=A0A3Q7IUM6_SOLLC
MKHDVERICGQCLECKQAKSTTKPQDAKKREKEMMHIQAKVTESIEKTIQRWPFERIEGERK